MRKPLITKEHGSWAVSLVPVITGISASLKIDVINLALFVITILFLFLSYTPTEILLVYKIKKHHSTSKIQDAKYFLRFYLFVAAVSGIVLVIISRQYFLLLFGLLSIILFGISTFISIKNKNVWSDFTAIAGLTLSAPAIIYLCNGVISFNNLLIYLMNLIFFGSSAFYIHFKMKINSLKERNLSLSRVISLGKLNLIYHLVTFGIITWFSILYPSWFLIAAYFPMVIHGIAGTFRIAKTNFKKLGFTFLAYSVLFTLFMSITV